MKVLFISRSTLFSVYGGDTVQMLNTASYLRNLNIQVDFSANLTNINYNDYDLIHFFNIIRPAEILPHLANTNKPFVISSIYVDYWEYETKNATGFKKILLNFLNANSLEYIKVLARFLKNAEPIKSLKYLVWGQKKSIQFLLKNAAIILPNSHSESNRLKKAYQTNFLYQKINNGIDAKLFKSNNTSHNNRTGILCVARIEGLKNQLSLIKAVNQTNLQLTLIGKPAPNHHAYYDLCKKEAGPNIHFIDFKPHEEMLGYYEKAKVHVLPSWFETTGLVSLEAAAMGCNLVISDKGDTREYFGDHAFYCNPESVASIKDAILKAYEAPFNENFRKTIFENYTWQKAAEQTLEAYKQVLNK